MNAALAYDDGSWSRHDITLTGPPRARNGAETQSASAFANQPPDWASDARNRLNLLTNLRAGWDGHNGLPPTFVALAYTWEVLCRIMVPGLPLPSIMPLSDGGVQLEWHRKGWDVEIGIFGGSKADVFVHELATGKDYEWELGADLSSLGDVISSIKD